MRVTKRDNAPYILFDLPLQKKARKRPHKSATDIPDAVAERPPENAPKIPSLFTASSTPLPIAAPKPMRGTETPEPNILKSTSYAPDA